MDLETKRRLYRQCRDEPLAPDDVRNVDFDHRGAEPVRGVSWVERLAAPIELDDGPTQQLVTGLPGSGKSTELRRLEARLQQGVDGNGLVVARIDAESALDLTQALDIPDIIAVIVDGAERALDEAEGVPHRADSEQGYLSRLWHWLKETEPELKSLDLGAGPAKLTLEMKTRPAFRRQLRGILSRHFTSFLTDARSELERLDHRAKSAGWLGLCVILDSLERLRGLGENWFAVLDSAVQVFGSGAPYLALPIHCIYTVPPALVNRLRDEIEFMPMVKLRDREGAAFDPGSAALREMVRRRIDDKDLEAILGSDFEARLARIIGQSGGYPREVILALRWLLKLPEHPAAETDLRRLENEKKERLSALIMEEDIPLLVRVAREKTLTIRDDSERPKVDRVLQSNIVLRYLNEEVWYDLHPALLEIPAIAEALHQTSTG